MDRRLFLLSTLALAGCGPRATGQTVICDPGLGPVLTRARNAWPKNDGITLYEDKTQALLDRAEATASAVVVTRADLLANRLQRLNHVRLEHRWQAQIAGRTAEIMVTHGAGPAQWRALAFARWLASDEAAPLLTDGKPPIAP